jgi:plasmid stability protein
MTISVTAPSAKVRPSAGSTPSTAKNSRDTKAPPTVSKPVPVSKAKMSRADSASDESAMWAIPVASRALFQMAGMKRGGGMQTTFGSVCLPAVHPATPRHKTLVVAPKWIHNETMPVTLSIKSVPDDLAEALRERARRNHRSIQGELMAMLEQAARPRPFPALALLDRIRALGIETPAEAVAMVREARGAR